MKLSSIKSSLKKENSSFLIEVVEKEGTWIVTNLVKYHQCTKEDAEDYFMEAVLIFRENVLNDRVAFLTSTRNYLYSTSINLCKKGVTKKKQMHVVQSNLSLLVGDQVQSHEEIQIENEWKAEFQKMAMDSFQQLSPSCQKVLKLFYVEKWSMEEIAQELNLSDANSAKTKKSRCFKKWDQLVEGIKLKKTL